MEDGQGDEKNGRENCTSSRENVVPNNNVIVNPYRKNANAGHVEHAATLRNPYKKTGSTNGTQVTSLYVNRCRQTLRCVATDNIAQTCFYN